MPFCFQAEAKSEADLTSLLTCGSLYVVLLTTVLPWQRKRRTAEHRYLRIQL